VTKHIQNTHFSGFKWIGGATHADLGTKMVVVFRGECFEAQPVFNLHSRSHMELKPFLNRIGHRFQFLLRRRLEWGLTAHTTPHFELNFGLDDLDTRSHMESWPFLQEIGQPNSL
jgi:hypothetical protein